MKQFYTTLKGETIMKPRCETSIRFNEEELYERVKESAFRLGISMNEVMNAALSLQLPLDFSDLACYRYMQQHPEEYEPASPF